MMLEQSSVNPYAGNSKLAAYNSVSVHSVVAEADPHGLVLMLMNGAKERMATARGCLERREVARKAKLLHSCVTIIAELRGSLNLEAGGALAQNLSDLYDYMIRRLLSANAENNLGYILEVEHLLDEVRTAWISIGPEVHRLTQPAPASAAAVQAR